MAYWSDKQPDISMQFDPREWAEFRAKLQPGRWNPAIKDFIEKLTDDMLKVAKKEAMPHPGADTGTIAGSINSRIDGTFRGEIYSNMREAKFVEFGRRPGGRMPPVSKLEEWSVRHGNPPGLGFAIARGIAIRGTKGLNMFRKAYDYGRLMTAVRVAETASAVERAWWRKFF